MPPPLLRLHRSNGAASPFLWMLATLFWMYAAAFSPAQAQQSTEHRRAAPPQLAFLGEYKIPTGLSVGGIEFGGISALDFDSETGRFWALSDDRAERGPARFYVLDLNIRGGERGGVYGVDIVEMVEMTGLAGDAYPPKSGDPEALRRAPGGGFYWAHERDASGDPFVGVMDAEGRTTRAFDLPAHYMPTGGDGRGIRINLGFESLTVDGQGRVVVATEQSLFQDGGEAGMDYGSSARVLVFDPASGAPVAEYLYPVGPIAALPIPASGFKTNGLVELLALPEGGFLAMERSYSAGQGNVVKLFVTDFVGADDISGVASLDERPPAAMMTKEIVLTLQAGGLVQAVDNLEAMSFGPEIDGKRTLVLMSDNNFNPNGQFTQILVFAIE